MNYYYNNNYIILELMVYLLTLQEKSSLVQQRCGDCRCSAHGLQSHGQIF